MKRGMRFVMMMVSVAGVLGCRTTVDLERHPDCEPLESASTAQNNSNVPSDSQTATSQRNNGGSTQVAGDAGTQPEKKDGAASGPSPSEEQTHDTTGGTASNESSKQASTVPSVVEKKIYIEKPIYYPDATPTTPAKPEQTVADAASAGVMRPSDYNGAAILYDYDESLVYQVFTMPLRVTDVYLQPGEKLVEQPFCGDTTRWNIGGGVAKNAGVETQHLYIKPTAEGLETTLIINTDRRIYHLIIKSFKDTFMFSVMWRYPGAQLPLDFLGSQGQSQAAGTKAADRASAQGQSDETAFGVDPALISTDYLMSYPKKSPPQWLPTMVLDDGSKTYIVLPDTIVHHQLPAVFGEAGELLNFRVKDNLIVIDRLVRRIELKLGNVTVQITKKGA
jgi:type IV secretion system protein TrbG